MEGSSVLGCSPNGFEVVVEKRTLNKLTAFLDNKQHPHHGLLGKQWSSFNRKLIQLCSTGGCLYQQRWHYTTAQHCAGTLSCTEVLGIMSLGYSWNFPPSTFYIHIPFFFNSLKKFFFTILLYTLYTTVHPCSF